MFYKWLILYAVEVRGRYVCMSILNWSNNKNYLPVNLLMKTGVVKVQRSVDRKMAQLISGHTWQPPRTAYKAVNHRICTVVSQYDQWNTWEYLRGIAHIVTSQSPSVSVTPKHTEANDNLCCSCKEHLATQWHFVEYILYHVANANNECCHKFPFWLPK